MKIVWIVYMVVILMLAPSLSWSHGTRGVTESAAGIRVKAEYDDGEPMSYAAVEVAAPDSAVVFQTGRTDRNGVFMFAPDRPGKWRVAIRDGMGHRLVLGRQIDPSPAAIAGPAAIRETGPPVVSRREGIVAGVAVIFGICGLFYGWQTRRRLSIKDAA